ncbi:ROK family protein [Nocardioides sp.]|uniref:ROK family protein n=1 Tax=Nocardioides sp. TaxID=35761 RepID=UPI002B275B52|nr:ROK family protein [Nocardioides sp.]
MARGEGHSGAGRDHRDYLVVRLGSGITATTVSGGQVVEGAAAAGGEIGHVRVDEFGPACTCGNSGCLDSFAALPALVEQARAAGESGRSADFARVLAEGRSLEIGDVVAAVAAGDRVAVQVARDAGRRVGEVLATLVAFANPAQVVLGGPVAALGDNLLAEVRAAVLRKAPTALTHDLRIDLSGLGERAVLIGAAHAATERSFGA